MTRAALTLGLALSLAACERQVHVEAAEPIIGMPATGGIGAAAGAGGHPGSGGRPGQVIAGAAGAPEPAAGGGGYGSAGAAGASGTGGASGGEAPAGLLANIDQAHPGAASMLAGFELLSERLQTLERPSVGTNGVSLAQIAGSGDATVLHVAWDGSAEAWHGSTGAYRVYTAAFEARHFSLLHAQSYGIFANGAGPELSGAPETYKEFVAASAAGVAWVDYPSPVVMTPGMESYGEIVLQRGDGTRAVLSDRTKYRAMLALSSTHVAYLEYASTAPGGIGQVFATPLAGGPTLHVAPSTLHQERPAIDGDWIVLEEYRSTTDAVIRAHHLPSGETRDVSPAVGFRTNADVLGSRVVWEDYRNGTADLYAYDLATGVEQPLVTGTGHSALPRLTGDGLIWVEAKGNQSALVRARFGDAP